MNGKRFYYTLLQECNTIWNNKTNTRDMCKPFLMKTCGSGNNGSLDGRYKYGTAHNVVKANMEKAKQAGFILFYGTSWLDCKPIATHKVNYNLLVRE